jgi:hypothetical protein
MKLSIGCLVLFLSTMTGHIGHIEPKAAASIEGFVTNDVAEFLPQAKIGAQSATGAIHRTATTDTSGYYLMQDIRPGSYTMWAEAKAYGCIVYPHITVGYGQRLRQDFRFAKVKRNPGNCEPLERSSE